MEIEIRKAEESDFQEIVNLFNEFALFEKLPEKMTNTVERMLNEKDFFNCFVALNSSNNIVGYVSYFFCYYTWIGKSLYMDDLYVKPLYRAKGIGTKLLNKLIEFAKESDCHKLRWQVSEWNKPAINFYKKIGAEINQIEQNCDLIF